MKSPRVYHFALPVTVPGFEVMVGLDELKSGHNIFSLLPVKVQHALDDASPFGSVTITKADCDSIDDVPWAFIASKLNLSWSKAPTSTAPDHMVVRGETIALPPPTHVANAVSVAAQFTNATPSKSLSDMLTDVENWVSKL